MAANKPTHRPDLAELQSQIVLDGDSKLGLQEFAYGRFEWIRLPDEQTPNGITIGRGTIEPGKEWPEHYHSGYEQMLYVVSGTGIHCVNGELRQLRPGVVEYLPAGARHYVRNTGDEPLVHLSVYHPIMPKEIKDLAHSLEDGQDDLNQVSAAELLPASTMQNIQDKFAEAVDLGVIMVDVEGNLVTRPTRLPQLCIYLRSLGKSRLNCPAFDPASGARASEEGHPTILECCPGIVCVVMPLRGCGKLVGHMACGFVKIQEPAKEHLDRLKSIGESLGLPVDTLLAYYHGIEVVLKAQIVAAASSLESIANAITSYHVREAQRRLESQYHAEMVKKLQLVRTLEREVQEAEFRALEARINPHFLFNALNTIAEAASEGGSDVEEIVYCLSDFLRFSLRNTKSTTTLREELRCLRNYLRIQHARFGEGLKTRIAAHPSESELADLVVPSMILQPLVENAISHGLAELNYTGLIEVHIREAGGRLRITVSDNGVGFEDQIAMGFSLLDEERKRQGIGIKYVITKLRHTFGDDCSFSIRSVPGQGTKVILDMPAVWSRG